MDVETALLMVAAAVGIVTAAAHLYGWLPRRYTERLAAVQHAAAQEIGHEVKMALDASLDRQRALASQDMQAAMQAQAAEAEKLGKSAEMSIVRGIGVDKQAAARVSSLLGEAILGPALPLLRQFAPGLADALEENPQLIDVVVRNPLFIKYVQPRIEQYLGSMGTGTPPAQEGGWGT